MCIDNVPFSFKSSQTKHNELETPKFDVKMKEKKKTRCNMTYKQNMECYTPYERANYTRKKPIAHVQYSLVLNSFLNKEKEMNRNEKIIY